MITTEAQNKAFVLEAFDALFNRRDYAAAERFWSPGYVQHSAHIAPGRAGLFNLIKSMPPPLKSSGSRRGYSSSIGMSSRTRQLKSNPRAVGRCSATRFQFTGRPAAPS